ncbi:MAG: C-GCAxxG-C-C family (seleno)protein [Erysipelotrichaceae bacterium]|nr:C-GCAxxG-C-C family (seleno)protein [Erysipelotrichaceae bacterium]
MSVDKSRREFLKKSGILIGGTALLGSALLTGCTQQNETAAASEECVPEIPQHPYPYAELDLTKIEQAAYESYYEGGCCYGAFNALLSQAKEKVGFPYTAIPADMFRNGAGGYGAGSLCGALGGAVAFIGLVCDGDTAKKVEKELFKWYTSTPIPSYQPEVELPATSVAPSVNCADSLSNFQKTAGIAPDDSRNRNRCGGLTADVAKKTAELLNIQFGYAEAPAAPETTAPAEETLADNEYIGEAEGYGGTVKVKVTMDGDKIAKIDVLSHSETAGVSDAAFSSIPDAIIAAQSTDVDVASGATYSSKAIMEAVDDALSKVKK